MIEKWITISFLPFFPLEHLDLESNHADQRVFTVSHFCFVVKACIFFASKITNIFGRFSFNLNQMILG